MRRRRTFKRKKKAFVKKRKGRDSFYAPYELGAFPCELVTTEREEEIIEKLDAVQSGPPPALSFEERMASWLLDETLLREGYVTEGDPLIGRRCLRDFGHHGAVAGWIVAHLPPTQNNHEMWLCVHDDGDCEELLRADALKAIDKACEEDEDVMKQRDAENGRLAPRLRAFGRGAARVHKIARPRLHSRAGLEQLAATGCPQTYLSLRNPCRACY